MPLLVENGTEIGIPENPCRVTISETEPPVSMIDAPLSIEKVGAGANSEIVAVPVAAEMVAPLVAPLSVTKKFSDGPSHQPSPDCGTDIVFDDSPAANVSVLLTAV